MLSFLTDNWLYILFFGLMAYMMFRGGGCCGGGHSSHNNSSGENHGGGCCGGGHTDHLNQKNKEKHNETYSENLTNVNIDTARDPVCGMIVSKAILYQER